LERVLCLCMLFDIEASSLAALALLFYVCGHGFPYRSCSIGNLQYAPEVWHQTPGTICIGKQGTPIISVVHFTVKWGDELILFTSQYNKPLCKLSVVVYRHRATVHPLFIVSKHEKTHCGIHEMTVRCHFHAVFTQIA
jgi:hypothetical protein